MTSGDDDLVIPETVPVDIAGQERPAFATLGALTTDEPPTEPGEEAVGRFVLAQELGRGGMGRVVAARDPRLRRTVAIKLMKQGTRSEATLARFVAEAQVTGQLDHPNIVPVHELGLTDNGEPWFAMKRVQGRSLGEIIKDLRGKVPEVRERWSRHRLLAAFVQVCNAIAYAHDRGVLHRDLKPSNIMLGAFGEVLVMDWGVAGLMGREDNPPPLEQAPTLVPDSDSPFSLGSTSEGVERSTVWETQEGATVGTPGYMSPEQTGGELASLDGRSDVFALGTILYELLTLHRAYSGPNLFAVVHALMSGPPVPPAERAPREVIPQEIADVAMKALCMDPEDRYPTAAALGEAVQAFLEGSRRRSEAAAKVDAAWRHEGRWLELRQERAAVSARVRELAAATPIWTPISDKAELIEARRRQSELLDLAQDAFDALVGACEAALSHDPDGLAAPSLLADAWWTRLEQAEAEGDTRLARHCANRVRAWDRGTLSARLDAPGAVSLRTEPSGAQVVCQRVDSTGLIWQLGPEEGLGSTPLQRVPLAQGSYVLRIRQPGYPDTVYPVQITRGWHWDAGVSVPLYRSEEIGDGWRYIPPGPFRCGGDPGAEDSLPGQRIWLDGYFIGELPVRMYEWVEFVNAVDARSRDEARRRVPKVDKDGPPYWPDPAEGEAWQIPERDQHGDEWHADWPAFGIDHDDCVAYARWQTEVTGVEHALPLEREWEKAGRGVDGRIFPWGNTFDATLCAMRDRDPALGFVRPAGDVPGDLSLYGVRDLAGGVHERCGDSDFDGNSELTPVRGASWISPPRWCRLTSRFGVHPANVFTSYGVRLVRRGPLKP